MDLERTEGLRPDGSVWLRTAAPPPATSSSSSPPWGIEIPPEAASDEDVFHPAGNLFGRQREQARLLADHLCLADRRIQHYLDKIFAAATVSNPVLSRVLR